MNSQVSEIDKILQFVRDISIKVVGRSGAVDVVHYDRQKSRIEREDETKRRKKRGREASHRKVRVVMSART